MSLAILDRWSEIRASLKHHCISGLGKRSTSIESANLCRALGITRPFLEVGADDQARKIINSEVEAWRQQNRKAYKARYPKERVPSCRKPLPLYMGPVLSLPALLKALQCVRYNLDGPAPELLEELIDTLQHIIIGAMPEYREARWF